MEIGTKTFAEFCPEAEDRLGIVIMGAGGDLEDWVNGVVHSLVEDGICKEGEELFDSIYTLSDNVKGTEGRTDLVLFFKPPLPEVGKLAMWRIKFGSCSWADDFADNYAKDFTSEKKVDYSKMSFFDVLDAFEDKNSIHTYEGQRGVKNLYHIVSALNPEYCDVIEFLEDNPGAVEAIVEWIKKVKLPEWRQSLIEALEDS